MTAQGVWRPEIFSEAHVVDRAMTAAEQPAYTGLIPPAMARRMSRGVKMGIHAAQQALEEASIAMPDAIITGTGWGCSEDSDKFLRNLWENDEQFLTPTSFIQSTHNTVAAQLALRLSCKGYNVTYTQGASSFEAAVLDALLQLADGEAEQVLLGGVDEMAKQTYSFLQAAGYIKEEDRRETVKSNTTSGVNYAEGALFFAVGHARTASTYAEVSDVALRNELETSETASFLYDFLNSNNLSATDIDAVMLGYNGDTDDDVYYRAVQHALPQATPLYYKQLSGQFDTCSAFALATAAYILKQQAIPPLLYWEEGLPQQTSLKNIVLYNQYRGSDHSLMLVRAC